MRASSIRLTLFLVHETYRHRRHRPIISKVDKLGFRRHRHHHYRRFETCTGIEERASKYHRY